MPKHQGNTPKMGSRV